MLASLVNLVLNSYRFEIQSYKNDWREREEEGRDTERKREDLLYVGLFPDVEQQRCLNETKAVSQELYLGLPLGCQSNVQQLGPLSILFSRSLTVG